jgi:hypothetical protein
MADDIRVKIDIFGDLAFRAKIDRMALRAMDMSEVLDAIGHEWIEWIEEQFGTEGKRFLTPWERLSFRTVKSRGGVAHPILFDEGILFDEMTAGANIRTTDHNLWLDLDHYAQEVGGRHQHGTSIMPARPIVRFTTLDQKHIYAMLSEYLFNDSKTMRARDMLGRFL